MKTSSNKSLNTKRGRHSHFQPPCPEDKIAELRKRAWSAFRAEVPPGFLDFLRRMNGLYFNGTVFYAGYNAPYVDNPSQLMEGFVEANELRREQAPHLLFFGESGMEYYAYDTTDQTYNVIDTVALDRYETYRDYNSLMVAALKKRLT